MTDISTVDVAAADIDFCRRQNLSLKPAWCPDGYENAKAGEATSSASLQALGSSLLGGEGNGLKRAHLLPNSCGCAMIWDTLVRQMLGRDVTQRNAWTAILGVMKDGKRFGSLRNASFNFLALDAEGDLLDTRPQLMFLPVLDIEQLRSWNGAGYNAVVIAANAWGYQRAGSCQETQCAERQALQTAFATFAAVGRSLCKLYEKDSFCGRLEVPAEANFSRFMCQNFQRHVAKNGLSTPAFEDGLQFPYCSFGRSSNPDEGWKAYTTSSSWQGQHPAPHPLLLLARSLNAWANIKHGRTEEPMRFLPACAPISEPDLDEVEWDVFESLERKQVNQLGISKGVDANGFTNAGNTG